MILRCLCACLWTRILTFLETLHLWSLKLGCILVPYQKSELIVIHTVWKGRCSISSIGLGPGRKLKRWELSLGAKAFGCFLLGGLEGKGRTG